jgi:AAA15 family ATPase/GTPase
MDLKIIKIQNYRSIDDLTFEVHSINDSSKTFSLIGVNEAGKSSILKAIAIKSSALSVTAKDFKDADKDILVEFEYEITKSDNVLFKEELDALEEGPYDFIRLSQRITINSKKPSEKINQIVLIDDEKGEVEITETDFNLDDIHTPIFWSANPQYLINQPIPLSTFASNPETSIPLKNCFYLADIDNIKTAIDKANSDSAEAEDLQIKLGDAVTNHIKSVWHTHPITITFMIMGGAINFHIKDNGKGKAKTADQRSDGFKQFISFLLTVSAENRNKELENTILLLDEPETHLHPQAQEFLLRELIDLSKNDRNNIVLFATHSNYMIDKEDLGRNYKVAKHKDDSTSLSRFESRSSTYASITYHVFDIATSDYHNELYGKAHEIYQNKDIADNNRSYILNFDAEILQKVASLTPLKPYRGADKKCTLPTYVRNCIHHPEAGNTFCEKDLKSSIESLIALMDKL